jgi:CheY-like chemotaxis protein
MMERLGYNVLAASRTVEAISLAEENAGEIHLLMTDVFMPEMNGLDLAGKLSALYPNLRRLFISGYTANVIAHQGVLDERVQCILHPEAVLNKGPSSQAARNTGQCVRKVGCASCHQNLTVEFQV